MNKSNISRCARRCAHGAGLSLVVLIVAGTVFASKKADRTSTWRPADTPIAVDGVNQEWQGKLSPVDKDVPASIGFYNDADDLYFCLTTGDRALRAQIRRLGLIVWIDAGGGKKKNFGIEFPVNMRGMTMIERDGTTEGGVTQRPIDADMDRLVVLGPGKNDRQDLQLDQARGIQAKLRDSAGVLVYELKVPLAKSGEHPYAIDAKPGAIVGVGLETPEFQRPEGRMAGGGRGPAGGGGWGGGIGGRGIGGMGGGGRGGYGGGGRRDRFGEAPKPLKQWTTVQVATPTS